MAIYWKKGPLFFLDAFLHSSRLDLPVLNKGRPFPFLTALLEGKWGAQTLEFLLFNGAAESLLHPALEQKRGL